MISVTFVKSGNTTTEYVAIFVDSIRNGFTSTPHLPIYSIL